MGYEELQFEADGQTWLRVPVHARIRATSREELPDFIDPANKATASKKKEMYWQDGKNPDLVWTSFVLDTEGVNKNWDYMPRTQLIKSHHSAKFKPMDMEHLIIEEKSLVGLNKQHPPAKNTIFGVMTNTALSDHEGKLLTAKEVADIEKEDDIERLDEEKIGVVAWAAFYFFLFPETVKSMMKSIDSGHMHVSMERWLKSWDFLVANSKGEYETVDRKTAEGNGVFDRWKARQTLNNMPVIRRTLEYVYGGVASTANPANELSRFIGQSKDGRVKAAASLVNDPVMQNLLQRHDEVESRFAVSLCEAEKAALQVEHERIHRAIAAYVG